MYNKDFFEEKIKEISKEKNILDIGSGHKFQGFLKYKEYFESCNYTTIDSRKEFNPDIIADIHNIPLPNNSVDAVICKSVLQFVKNPFKAVDEIFRVLKPSGKCLVYVPFLYIYHGGLGDSERDYWRFSTDGITELFSKFRRIETCPTKGHFATAVNILPKKYNFITKIIIFFANFLDKKTFRFQSGKQSSGYIVFLIK